MKKTVKLTTVVLLIFSILLLKQPATVLAEEDIEIAMPDRLNIKEEETTFTVTLKSNLEEGTVLNISYTDNPCLINGNEESVPLIVEASQTSFKNKGDFITFTLRHEELPEGKWELDFELDFTPVKTKAKKKTEEVPSKTESVQTKTETITYERKTLYALEQVNEWNLDEYSLEAPEGAYLARTQYATETALFSDSVYSESVPEDGIYEERTLYGYESRTKEEVKTPYTYTHIRYYNAYGACPLGCDAGTENFYQTGCECRMTEYLTGYNTSYNYGVWEVQGESFRMGTPYEESDVVRGLTKTVYLTPVSFTENNDWSFEEKSGSSNTKAITRTVYSVALSYKEPGSYSETVPTADSSSRIVSKEFCRIIRNGNPESWGSCN